MRSGDHNGPEKRSEDMVHGKYQRAEPCRQKPVPWMLETARDRFPPVHADIVSSAIVFILPSEDSLRLSHSLVISK